MKISVVGGGNAGVFTALYIAWYGRDFNLEVDLIHNPKMPPEEVARAEMDELSDKLFSNTVIEDWSYELEETEETGIGNISNDNAGTSKHALFDA